MKLGKHYIQFSKVIVMFLILNMIAIEIYSMIIMAYNHDLTSLYALLAICGGEAIGGIIWYMKNSATEKKAKSEEEIAKINSGADTGIVDSVDESEIPDVVYTDEGMTGDSVSDSTSAMG